MLLHTLSLVLPVTGDSTNNGTRRRPLKKFIPYLTSLIIHFILKILTCVYLVLPGLGRFFAVQRADKPLGNNSKPQFSGSEEQLISRSIKEDPLWQRLQHLETLVNDLVNKPTKIPQEKDDMLRESLSRIKSIEYDLQKTKKVNYPSLTNISLRL